MRKTLTVISVVLAAGSLAACKMFWEKGDTPPTPVATDTTSIDTTAVADTAKPADQTAAMSADKPATPPVEKTDAPPAPPTK